MQISLAEPFISQDSEKLRFQESRKPQSTNVFNKSAGFFARHQRAAPFRREESLRQFIQVCVFFQVILQFGPDSLYFGDAFYAFQTLLEAPLTDAMAFRVSTMHRATDRVRDFCSAVSVHK